MISNITSAIEYFSILLPLALILFLGKGLALVCQKIKIPQVIGMLVAGILIGLIKYIPNQNLLTTDSMEGVSFIAKIGVILIMFSAGIETDLKKVKSTGVASIIITLLGVIVPVGLGFVVSAAFYGDIKNGFSNHTLMRDFFYGTILAATSVSVTVATLKELGKLDTRVGTSIISAAIIDDIIGVILLSLFIGLDKGEGAKDAYISIAKMIGFFAAAIVLGIGIHYFLKWVEKRWPHTRRLPIFSFAVCFFYSYAAEKWFGVADITGAFVAGLIISTVKEHEYVDSKIEVSNYLIFAPVFFANIGINADFSSIDPSIIGFGFVFIIVGLLGKFVGCGLGGLISRFSFKDSIRIGLGMMVRAEVLLVCTQKGIDSFLISSDIMPFILILILLSTLLTPILLKLSYKNEANYDYELKSLKD